MIVDVESRPDLKKDTNSGAILKVDPRARDEYFSKREQLKKQKEDMQYMKSKLEEVEQIKNDITEIKELLKGLLK